MRARRAARELAAVGAVLSLGARLALAYARLRLRLWAWRRRSRARLARELRGAGLPRGLAEELLRRYEEHVARSASLPGPGALLGLRRRRG